MSELKGFIENDPALFPDRKLQRPSGVAGKDGIEEYLVEAIIDSRCRGRGWQFLVRWVGYGPEDDRWLSATALDECAAMDEWYRQWGDGPENR
jgi:hypothetical protein